MPTLTTQQMNTLQQYLNSNDVAGFYSTLQVYGDPYGRLGLGVTLNNTWQGQIANIFAESSAATNNKDMSYGSPLWMQVNKDFEFYNSIATFLTGIEFSRGKIW